MSNPEGTVKLQARPRYQDPLETWGAKFVRKFNENPWVPIGTYITSFIVYIPHYS